MFSNKLEISHRTESQKKICERGNFWTNCMWSTDCYWVLKMNIAMASDVQPTACTDWLTELDRNCA